jgi:hypothetical protein
VFRGPLACFAPVLPIVTCGDAVEAVIRYWLESLMSEEPADSRLSQVERAAKVEQRIKNCVGAGPS